LGSAAAALVGTAIVQKLDKPTAIKNVVLRFMEVPSGPDME
jgi:hypothetical protein